MLFVVHAVVAGGVVAQKYFKNLEISILFQLFSRLRLASTQNYKFLKSAIFLRLKISTFHKIFQFQISAKNLVLKIFSNFRVEEIRHFSR